MGLVVVDPENDATGPGETGNRIDMPVRLLVGKPVAQPHDPERPREERETFFNLLPVELGIAVLVQEALLGRQQRAGAVAMKRTPFANQRRSVSGQIEMFQNPFGKL